MAARFPMNQAYDNSPGSAGNTTSATATPTSTRSGTRSTSTTPIKSASDNTYGSSSSFGGSSYDNSPPHRQLSLKPYPLMRVLHTSIMEYAGRSPSRFGPTRHRLRRGPGSGGSGSTAGGSGSFGGSFAIPRTWSEGSSGSSSSSPYGSNGSSRSPYGANSSNNSPILDELSPGLGSGRLLSLETPRHRIGRRLQKHLSDRMFRDSFWNPAAPRDSLPKPFTFKATEGNGAVANTFLVLVALLACVGITIAIAMVAMPFIGMIETYITGEPSTVPTLFPHPYAPFAYMGGGTQGSLMAARQFDSGLNWGCEDWEDCGFSKGLLAAALGLSALLVLLLCIAFFVDKVLSRLLGHIQVPAQKQSIKRRPSESHIGNDWRLRLYGMNHICRMWKGGRVEIVAGNPPEYEVRHRGMTFSL